MGEGRGRFSERPRSRYTRWRSRGSEGAGKGRRDGRCAQSASEVSGVVEEEWERERKKKDGRCCDSLSSFCSHKCRRRRRYPIAATDSPRLRVLQVFARRLEGGSASEADLREGRLRRARDAGSGKGGGVGQPRSSTVITMRSQAGAGDGARPRRSGSLRKVRGCRGRDVRGIAPYAQEERNSGLPADGW